jgi:hypothetical protein
MTYQEQILSLANSLLVHFDEVYHSVEIVQADERFPAVVLKNEWPSLAPGDTQEALYIRRNGDDEVMDELKLGSCIKSYKMRSPLRVVFFKDNAETQNKILAHLLQSVLIGGTKLTKVIRDKWKLKKDESSGDYHFGAKTAYFAIDINIFWELKPDSCEEDFCQDIVNPLTKSLCPAAV